MRVYHAQPRGQRASSPTTALNAADLLFSGNVLGVMVNVVQLGTDKLACPIPIKNHFILEAASLSHAQNTVAAQLMKICANQGRF